MVSWAKGVGCEGGGDAGVRGCAVLTWVLTCLSRPSPPAGLPLYMKSLRWALVVMAVFLAVSAVAIVALASRTGMVPPPGPPSPSGHHQGV